MYRGWRCSDLSLLTVEYFPNPDLSAQFTDGVYAEADVPPSTAMFVEAWGTFVLVFVIFVAFQTF